jgi:hypothetical protein
MQQFLSELLLYTWFHKTYFLPHNNILKQQIKMAINEDITHSIHTLLSL